MSHKLTLVDCRAQYFWIEVAEFYSGVVGGEMPVDLALAGVRGVLPGGELGIEGGEVADAAVQACRARTDSSISAMFSQEPCFGVWWISRRWARANAWAGSNAS